MASRFGRSTLEDMSCRWQTDSGSRADNQSPTKHVESTWLLRLDGSSTLPWSTHHSQQRQSAITALCLLSFCACCPEEFGHIIFYNTRKKNNRRGALQKYLGTFGHFWVFFGGTPLQRSPAPNRNGASPFLPFREGVFPLEGGLEGGSALRLYSYAGTMRQ